MGSRMKDTYDLIREMQEASFQKYGSYSHAAGVLGVWLDTAVHCLPKREQQLMTDRLLNAIEELKQQ